jgi:hypothetical protein
MAEIGDETETGFGPDVYAQSFMAKARHELPIILFF